MHTYIYIVLNCQADVIVAHQNPVYEDIPYTLQFGKCGEPGSYIHFTPNYLLDDKFIGDHGPRGKQINNTIRTQCV